MTLEKSAKHLNLSNVVTLKLRFPVLFLKSCHIQVLHSLSILLFHKMLNILWGKILMYWQNNFHKYNPERFWRLYTVMYVLYLMKYLRFTTIIYMENLVLSKWHSVKKLLPITVDTIGKVLELGARGSRKSQQSFSIQDTSIFLSHHSISLGKDSERELKCLCSSTLLCTETTVLIGISK